jgi:hypothetical protein
MKRLRLLAVSLSVLLALFATTAASAHLHGITPLLTLAGDCGVTSVSNTGANRAQGDPIAGLIPRDVGKRHWMSGMEASSRPWAAPLMAPKDRARRKEGREPSVLSLRPAPAPRKHPS